MVRADTFWKRFKGLMFRDTISPDETFFLSPCNGIHTFFMRFEIDAIFLNRNLEVVRLCERLRPNRLGVLCPEAYSVLECRAGFIAAHRVGLKQVLKFPSNWISSQGPVRASFSS